MVISHSSVSLPEGKSIMTQASLPHQHQTGAIEIAPKYHRRVPACLPVEPAGQETPRFKYHRLAHLYCTVAPDIHIYI